MVNSKDSIMIRLLNACARILGEKGANGMFVDGIKGCGECFQRTGKLT